MEKHWISEFRHTRQKHCNIERGSHSGIYPKFEAGMNTALRMALLHQQIQFSDNNSYRKEICNFRAYRLPDTLHSEILPTTAYKRMFCRSQLLQRDKLLEHRVQQVFDGIFFLINDLRMTVS